MEVSNKLVKYIAIGLGAFLVVGALYFAYVNRQHEKERIALQNEIAKRDQTIEVQKDVYAKLTLELDNLKLAIDTTTAEGRRLADEVKKNNADLLAVNNTLVKLKEQVAKGQGKQSEPTPGRLRVDFGQDFGYARVDGWTITNPPQYELKLSQGSKPLKLTLALTQLPDKSWKTFVASSDSNVSVDIGVSAVNPYILQPKWYERVKLRLDVGVGDGVLGGVGASYKFGKYDVGPSIWGVTDGRVFYGGSIVWAPFER